MGNLIDSPDKTITLQQEDLISNFNLDKINSRVKDIKVLMYHRVIGEEQANSFDHWTGVEANDFEIQMMLLEHFGYTPISFNDFRLYLLDRLKLPKKPIILTFDDGYKDFYNYAYPILKKYGFKAVLFALGNRSIRENIWDDSESIQTAPLLNDKQLLELNDYGFEIGAHTMNHPSLTSVSIQKAEYEIRQSKASLERLLDNSVYTFCYPYGLQNKRLRQLVRRAGYCFACSVYTGPHQFGESFYNIRRITIKKETSLFGFALSVLTPNEYLKLAYSIKKVINGGTIYKS